MPRLPRHLHSLQACWVLSTEPRRASKPEQASNSAHTYSTTRLLLQRNKSRKGIAKIQTESPSSRSLSAQLHLHVEISSAARPTTAQAEPGGSRSQLATAGSSLRANKGSGIKRGFGAAQEPYYNITSFSIIMSFSIFGVLQFLG